jgi:FkbM family methyltransferase
MKLRIKGTPVLWLFWNPYQGFWNWNLCKIIEKIVFIPFLSKSIIKGIISFDTFFLRIKLKSKAANINKSGYSPQKTINYFDLGTHNDAFELRWVVDDLLLKLPNPYKIYAFEANPDSYSKAIINTNYIRNLKFYNVALVNQKPESGKIRLFTGGNGHADSIYRNTVSYVEVPAQKISDIIKNEKIDLEKGINILRMNIEGAEYDVINDLIENDLIKYFDGFYGMWDDLSKINYEKSKEFRKLLKNKNIFPYPFNGRDMNIKMRTDLIKMSLEKSIFGEINSVKTSESINQ